MCLGDFALGRLPSPLVRYFLLADPCREMLVTSLADPLWATGLGARILDCTFCCSASTSSGRVPTKTRDLSTLLMTRAWLAGGYSTEFRVTIEVAAQRRGDQARPAVADRPPIDFDHRHDALARRGNEGLARLLRLVHRERTHV